MNKLNHSTTKVAILALIFAIKDGVCIEEDDVLLLCRDIMEENTSISLDYLKRKVNESYKLDTEQLKKDAQFMTVAQMADKWDMSKDAIRSYCNRNKIIYKKQINYKRNKCTSMN